MWLSRAVDPAWSWSCELVVPDGHALIETSYTPEGSKNSGHVLAIEGLQHLLNEEHLCRCCYFCEGLCRKGMG